MQQLQLIISLLYNWWCGFKASIIFCIVNLTDFTSRNPGCRINIHRNIAGFLWIHVKSSDNMGFLKNACYFHKQSWKFINVWILTIALLLGFYWVSTSIFYDFLSHWFDNINQKRHAYLLIIKSDFTENLTLVTGFPPILIQEVIVALQTRWWDDFITIYFQLKWESKWDCSYYINYLVYYHIFWSFEW